MSISGTLKQLALVFVASAFVAGIGVVSWSATAAVRAGNATGPAGIEQTLGAGIDGAPTASGCPCDIAGPTPGSLPDGVVDVNDLNKVLDDWGPCPTTCPADITDSSGGLPDGIVDVNDLVMVKANLGPCP